MSNVSRKRKKNGKKSVNLTIFINFFHQFLPKIVTHILQLKAVKRITVIDLIFGGQTHRLQHTTDFRCKHLHVQPRNPYWRGRSSTVDLLIKIGCLVKKRKTLFLDEKQLIWTSYFKEFNRTYSSPFVRIPWLNPLWRT